MPKSSRRSLAAALLLASSLAGVGAAHAQTAAPAPSESAMVNLVRALVQKGALDQATGDLLIRQAEGEAAQAQAIRQANASEAIANPPTGSGAAPADEGQHIQYVPEIVQDQLRDQVKQELTAEAEKKGWISPNVLPSWVNRVAFGGDLRVRAEGDFFSNGNAGDFTNVGAINSGAPYNIDSATNPFNPPTLNSLQNRSFANLRFRLTFDADVAHDIDVHARLASGSDNQPVTTNQTLGNYFQKDAIWLDRAFVDWHPVDGLHLYAGRMQNPFKASDLVWDEDVNPDGLAGTYQRQLTDRLSAYVTGAAFALSYVSAADPSTALGEDKTPSSRNKFIFAGQAGGAFDINDRLTAHLNGDYYYYDHVVGLLSQPCLNTSDYCSTDYTRPGYMQEGNTVFAVRNLVALDPTNTASPQYFGLASQFRVLELSGDLTFRPRDNLQVVLSGNFARNLGFSTGDVEKRSFNASTGLSQIANNLTCTADISTTAGVCPSGNIQYHSGPNAYQVRFSVGSPVIRDLGDWSFSATYKYIEPDALLDAFTDQDFHLGGANAKGFVLIGTLGVRPNTNVSIRWFDTDQVFGPRFAVDVLQADLNLKF